MIRTRHLPAFTLLELMITISVIAVLAGILTFAFTSTQKSTRDTARDTQVRIISDALEKYYRTNGEYPSVALMTSSNVDTVKTRLGITDPNIFKLPNSQNATSIATTNPSPTTLVYAANTTDGTKNTQCQTDVNGYCDGFTLQYVKESSGTTSTITSLKTTFTAVRDGTTCDVGDTQNGTTCTHTYAATYQAGSYTCPSGGTLSGTTCTNSYAANYSSGGSGYYCDPAEGTTTQESGYGPGTRTITRSGSTCYSTFTYPAMSTGGGGYYSCPNTANGEVLSGTTCVGTRTYPATANVTYTCAHPNYDSLNAQNNCRHERPNYTTSGGCTGAGYTWGGSNCFDMHGANSNTTYSCPSGGTVSGSNCTSPSSYPAFYNSNPVTYYCNSGATLNGSTCSTSGSFPATYYSYSAYYYCSGSDTLNGTSCTNAYSATQGTGYYTCPSGGTVSGTSCSYTYELQG